MRLFVALLLLSWLTPPPPPLLSLVVGGRIYRDGTSRMPRLFAAIESRLRLNLYRVWVGGRRCPNIALSISNCLLVISLLRCPPACFRAKNAGAGTHSFHQRSLSKTRTLASTLNLLNMFLHEVLRQRRSRALHRIDVAFDSVFDGTSRRRIASHLQRTRYKQ